MLRRTLITALAAAYAPGQPQPPPSHYPRSPEPDPDIHLPNGKSQRDEILKSEYRKSIQDASDLIRLAEDLKADLEKAGTFVKLRSIHQENR